MLCEEIEVNGALRQYGLDGAKVTEAYRELIAKELLQCEAQGDVAEWKFDGTRVIAKYASATVNPVILQNREGRIYTRRLPEIVNAFKSYLGGSWVIDGEVVYVDKNGREQFTASQRRCSTQEPLPSLIRDFPVEYAVWDLLSINNVNIEDSAYLRRKVALDELLSKVDDDVVHYVPYMMDLQMAWKQVIKEDREGLIVKDSKSGYEHKRSWKWRKVKNWKWEKLHVVGYTPGIRARFHFFGALVLENSEGQYRGLAGSGFDDGDLQRFKHLFADAPDMSKPFSDSQVGSCYTAKKVETEVLVKYYQLTEANVMRFPIYSMG
jgi:bifunctional non-homologous end joining protein LigD